MLADNIKGPSGLNVRGGISFFRISHVPLLLLGIFSMGNTTSIGVVRDCLTSAVGGFAAHVAFQDTLLYQTSAVKPYNLNVPVTPAAVTYPQSANEVAAIVKCASDYDYKVQARSGGHSFGNFGMIDDDGSSAAQTFSSLIGSRPWGTKRCHCDRYEALLAIFYGRVNIHRYYRSRNNSRQP